jgi:hypothetical protein
MPRTRKRLSTIDQTPHLSFDECVEIAFFPENDDPDFLQSFTTTMTLSSLENWSHKEGKPWSKKRCKKDTRVQSQFLWPFSQLRLSDAWHNPLPEGFQEQGDPDQEEDPDIIPDPTGAPQFVHDLLARAEEHGAFSDLDSDGDLYIRHGIFTMKASGFVSTPNSLSSLKIGEDGNEILVLHGGTGSAQMRKSRSMWSNLTLTEDTSIGQFMLML